MTIPAINRIYFSNIDKINRIFTHQLLDLEKSAPACRFGQKTMKKSHSYRTFILDIPSGGVYTALICRMKGDRPRLTAPRENTPRLKARLGRKARVPPPEGMTQPMRYKGLSGFQQSGWNRGCSAFVPTVGWMFFIYVNIQWR